jgi:outer membrane protein assembly factor BamE (lipoprotein component of BamABCDE complex)
MRQLSWFLILSLFVIVGCQTPQTDLFTRVHNDMSKDTVLDLLGSPIRTEQIDGKEKWAYKFYVGEDKDEVLLRQVTFLNGKVINYGDDVTERERILQIQKNDEKRAVLRKGAAEKRLKNENVPYDANQADTAEPQKHKTTMEDIEKERYYQEMSGKHSQIGTGGAN